MSRTKFEIYYSKDNPDATKAGTKYKPSGKNMIVMNNEGIFFLFNGELYYNSLRKLSDVIDSYDVKFKVNDD